MWYWDSADGFVLEWNHMKMATNGVCCFMTSLPSPLCKKDNQAADTLTAIDPSNRPPTEQPDTVATGKYYVCWVCVYCANQPLRHQPHINTATPPQQHITTATRRSTSTTSLLQCHHDTSTSPPQHHRCFKTTTTNINDSNSSCYNYNMCGTCLCITDAPISESQSAVRLHDPTVLLQRIQAAAAESESCDSAQRNLPLDGKNIICWYHCVTTL